MRGFWQVVAASPLPMKIDYSATWGGGILEHLSKSVERCQKQRALQGGGDGGAYRELEIQIAGKEALNERARGPGVVGACEGGGGGGDVV
ncbi:hypothetical protein MVEN_02587800 [Mycena venus]|uniref:Uncharacterized protein n=1 Tax=Mycena venus TaxID=2733690 RepID=A0A8H6TWX4_9AGAR|nr:hypothetical protein MVEN_02587800 [Mycena venus]